MAEFDAAHVLNEAKERGEQLERGDKLVPILAAVIAVCAALATLFANHSSISGLATKNEAILTKSKAVDSWNHYQAKKIRLEVIQALVNSGVATNPKGLAKMNATIAHETSSSNAVLADAQKLDAQSDDEYESAERFMQSYEKYEVAATFFEVSIVLVSITALMRTRVLMYAGCVLSLVGVVFFIQGWVH
ncbi:MAG TPA: DUF4337 family protein [Candidatus Baltobacteraceae bacterium]